MDSVVKVKTVRNLSAQEIGEKIIKRPKGTTACEAADRIFTSWAGLCPACKGYPQEHTCGRDK